MTESLIVASFTKLPGAEKDYTIDWSQELAASDSIASYVLEVITSGTLTVGQDSNATDTVSFVVAGGAAGGLYEIRCTITTSTGIILIASIYVSVSYLVADTTSYVELDEADQYFALSQNATWMAYTQEARTGYLIRAMRVLERQRWVGDKNDAAQLLEWPRSGTGVDGVADDTTPQRIKDAQCELAAMIGAGTLDVENDANQAQKLKSIKAGSVALEYFRGAEGSPRRFPTIVQELLRDFLGGNGLVAYGSSGGTAGVSSTADDFGHTEGI